MLAEPITTSRLVLRRPRAADAGPIFEAWAQDPAVTRYLSWRPHRSQRETEQFIERSLAAWDSGHHQTWVITLRDHDAPIGLLDVRPEGHLVCLGYLLARAHWGRGYMTEAVREVVARALAVPAVWRVWAVCDVANQASARVLEKAGLEREGTLRRFSLHPNVSPEPRDAYLYARVRE